MDYKFYTPKEIAEILRISYRKVLDLILMGELPALQVGREYRINENEFNQYLIEYKVKGFYSKTHKDK
jgi:excisionase family DNA binding protein|tara:strand:- start:1039 stop:1242 length:204 start_codon:yes stop_codon:yes gene_type:complete